MKAFLLRGGLVLALCMCLMTIFTGAGTAYAAASHATNPAISCPGQSLLPGYVWNQGNVNTWIACSGRQLKLAYDSDGTGFLRLFCNGNQIWAEGGALASAFQSPDYASFQSDGNLVVYTNYPWGVGAAFASGTDGQGATRFQLQGDGNLVIYTGSGRALWASNTSGQC